MYGVGSGHNVAFAKRSALQDIASQISTTIQSESKLSTSSIAGDVSRSFLRQIDTHVQAMTFPGHQVARTAQRGETTYALVRVDRRKLAERLLARARAKFSGIKRRLSSEAISDLQYIAQIHKDRQKIAKIRRSVVLASQLGFSPETAMLQKVDDFVAKEHSLKGDLSIDVVYSGKASGREIARVLAGRLLELGLDASAVETGTNGEPRIVLDVSVKTYRLNGSYNAKLRVVFNTYDAQGTRISKVEKEFYGSSMTDYSIAKKGAAQRMEKAIKQEGLYPYLGI